ncbi:hypothetical protein DFJ73DRAFT_49008 [Zopfochytrium polystomum]|nr:hypothetical protein DFJ73DRAFT_49008 [Zopfochytrium polystomum]
MTMPSKDPQDQQLRERTSSTQPLLRPPQTVRKQHPPPPPPPTGSRRIGTSASGRFPIDDIRETPRHVSHGATSGTTAVGMRSTRPVRMPAQPTRPPLGAIENHALQNGAHQQGSKKLHVPLGPRGHENAEAGGIASRRYSVLPRELLSHQPRRPLAPPHSAAAAATAAAPAATIRSTRIPDFEPESLSETVRPVAPAQQQSAAAAPVSAATRDSPRPVETPIRIPSASIGSF